jgi:hypothetical protein
MWGLANSCKGILALVVAGALLASAAGATGPRAHVVLNREGLGAKDNTNFGGTPDPSGAIGRRYYLEAVNARLALYSRRLRLVASRDAYAFWHKSNFSQLVDPYVVWDDQARRYYAVTIFNGRGGKNNQLLFAWSKRGRRLNLSSSWCRTSVKVGAFFDDYPKLGFSRRHVLIGTNLFNSSHDEMLSARVWVLGKPLGNGCRRPPVKRFGTPRKPLHRADGRLAFTPVPVVSVGSAGRAYVVAADCVYEIPGEEPPPCSVRERKANQITVWHVAGRPGRPRLVRDGGIDVPVFRIPSLAPQPGTSEELDTSDARLYQAVSAPDPTKHLRDAIWTQHAVAGPGGRAEIRWYELDPRRLRVVRSGTVRSSRNWVFSGAISPTRRGRARVLSYVVAGRKLLPELRLRVRGAGSTDVILGRSKAPERCDLGPEACPWGDYAQATPDPLHRGVVWGSNELMGAPRTPDALYWRTRNFAARAP